MMGDSFIVPCNTTLKRSLPSFDSSTSPQRKRRKLSEQQRPPRHWTTNEDDLLFRFIHNVGGKENVNWQSCSTFLLEHTQLFRSANACRHRFNTQVKVPNIPHQDSQKPLAPIQVGVVHTPTHQVNKSQKPLAPIQVGGVHTPTHQVNKSQKPLAPIQVGVVHTPTHQVNKSQKPLAPIQVGVVHKPTHQVNKSFIMLPVYCKSQTTRASCGIQTDVTFAPSDKVVWASRTEQHQVREMSGEVLLESTPNQKAATAPSLRSLLISPIAEDGRHHMTDASQDSDLSFVCSVKTPQRTSLETLTSRKLFFTSPESTIVPPKLSAQVDTSQSMTKSQAHPISLVEDRQGDHMYGKTKVTTTPRIKRLRKVKPQVEALKCKLSLAESGTPLTLKQQASLKLSLKDATSANNVATAAMSIPSVRGAIVNTLADELSVRPDAMQNRKHGQISVLMKKTYNDLQQTHLIDIVKEFMEKFPELFKIVLSMVNGRKDLTSQTLRTLIPRLAMIYGIIMQTRIPSLSRLQRVMTMALTDQICNQKVYDRLNVLGITLCYPTALDVMKAVGSHFRDQLLTAVKGGKRLRLIGDNLNFMQGVAHETIDHHKHMMHMFASCALMSEQVFTEKSIYPEIPLGDLTVDDITFSTAEYTIMRDDLVVVVAEILAKYLPQLKYIMECVPKDFGPHHPEFSHKTGVIPLPVLNLNEQFDKDTVQILDYYEGLVNDLPLESNEPIHVGGDQLTRERFSTALKIRLGNLHGRFAHLGPATFEMFHLGMNFLEKMVFLPLWSKVGEEELGTLRGEKERIIRNSVDPDVAKAYEADKTYFVNYTSAHIVEAALEFFGMEGRNDLPTKNKPPETATLDERRAWVYQTLRTLIDHYCFPFWSKNDKRIYVAQESFEEQWIVTKLRSGEVRKIKARQKNVTLKPAPSDKKKTYAHYVLEVGLTFIYFLRLCKTPDRSRLLGLFKLMMQQLKGRKNAAKYPLELLLMLLQQYSLLSQQRAHQVLHGCFVNTKGRPDTNIPADLQMEWVVKQNKRHIRHMFSNKSIDNIFAKSSALPGMHSIAENFDADAEVLIRSKSHNPKDIDKDEIQIMDDLRTVRPFEFHPGRAYRVQKFASLKVSQAKNLRPTKLKKWFTKHKKLHLQLL